MATATASKGMTSDSQVSETGLQPSDEAKQPNNIWYGRKKVQKIPSTSPGSQDTSDGTEDKPSSNVCKRQKDKASLTDEQRKERRRQNRIRTNRKKIGERSPLLGSSRLQGRVTDQFKESCGITARQEDCGFGTNQGDGGPASNQVQGHTVYIDQGGRGPIQDQGVTFDSEGPSSHNSHHPAELSVQGPEESKAVEKQATAGPISAGGPPPPPVLHPPATLPSSIDDDAAVLSSGDDTSSIEGIDFDYQDLTAESSQVATLEFSAVVPTGHFSSSLEVCPVPEGHNTVIAILDSGINAAHMAFSGAKILPESRSFVSQDILDYSDHLGHGTQCAGIACGNEISVQIANSSEPLTCKGAAVGAKVLVCKVVRNGSEIADIDAVCRAIQYIVDYNNKHPALGERVNVISLSFGMSFFSRELSRKIEIAVDSDIVVICAASNDGKKNRQPITYPARLGHVICIGSCNEYGKASPFSPVGREIDFLAPGETIWAPTVDVSNPSASYTSVSGTSFATPLVAGLVCQLIDDLKYWSDRFKKPELFNHLHNVWGVRELLKHMATVQGTHHEESGFGALDPIEYFDKTPQEKMRIMKNILGPSYT